MADELRELIRGEIVLQGPMSFARFMELALYEPGFGYYARKQSATGKAGDFFTSVSVGACYGELLASKIAEIWESWDQPEEFHLVEQGANDGMLFRDILNWIGNEKPECLEALQGHVIEPLESARSAQQNRFSDDPFLAGKIQWHHAMPARLGICGIYFCNELLDAFPVNRVRWNGSAWLEMMVNENFEWVEMPLNFELPIQISTAALKPGHTTEVCCGIEGWVSSISKLFERGCYLITDYGLDHDDYHNMARSDGTLRGYQNHQMITSEAEFLKTPGDIDLTTHVNWTQVVDAARNQGLSVTSLDPQMRFLTNLARPFLLKIEQRLPFTAADRKWLSQFQTLTHPGQMGGKFQTMVLDKI